MSSHFPGYTKLFLKLSVDNELLTSKRELLLGDKSPTYEPHVTLMVMHVKTNSTIAPHIKSKIRTITGVPTTIDAKALRYEILGTRPECFSVVFDTDPGPLMKLIDDILLFIQMEFELELTSSIVSEKYEYFDFMDGNTPIVRVPKPESKKWHTTLCTIDYNKRLEKEYSNSKDNKLDFIERLLGPLPEEMVINVGRRIVVS